MNEIRHYISSGLDEEHEYHILEIILKDKEQKVVCVFGGSKMFIYS